MNDPRNSNSRSAGDTAEVVDPRSFTADVSFPDPERIRVYDTTLRDGEQTPGVAFTPEQKFRVACMLSDMGVHIIDVGFPSVSESERESLRRAVRGKRDGLIRADAEVMVVCRTDRKDVDTILRTLDEAGASPEDISIVTFTSASDLHILVKLRETLLAREKADPEGKDLAWYREANIRMLEETCRYIASQGFRVVEFATEDASRSDADYLVELVGRAVDAGATRYVFPDTTGSLTPEATRFYVRRLRSAFPDLPLASHFHNDFDLAAINTIVALQEGMEVFSVSINGIGERAGNTALHNVVVALEVLYGVRLPGFRYDLIKPLSELVESLSGIPIRPTEPVVGRNVFAHESGLHAHGMLLDPRTYEPIPSELLGVETRFVYGKHTGFAILTAILGRHRARLEACGIVVDDAFTRRVMDRVKLDRERMAAERVAEGVIARYRSLLSDIEIDEEQVVRIAEEMATG